MLLSRRILLGAIGTLPLARVAQGAPIYRLTVLHMNDFHSRHAPVDGRSMTCTASPGPTCFGSSPRLASAIREQRQAAEADGRIVVLLDGGDQFQGSLFYTAHHGMAELAVQHAVGTDAMAVGNHEFDNGPPVLAAYVKAARFPVIAANIDARADADLRGCIPAFAMIERGGLKIGLIGLTTLETEITSSPGPGIRFTEPRAALAVATKALQERGAQIIILLSHLGLPIDRTLEAPGVAMIVGGHTHTLLSNDEPGAEGPHPEHTVGPLIVQAGAYGRYLGRLDLDLDAGGGVVAYGGGCRHIGLDLAEDPEVAAIVARFAKPLEALRNRPVATLNAVLDVAGCRLAPCAFGTLVADTLRAGAHGASVGLMNAGGLRVALPAGAVTLGQVLDALPFGNTLATVTLSGADLQAAVIHGATMLGKGGFPQWSGLRMGFAGVEVEAPGGGWSALDPAASYLVATNDFLRKGGDGYTVLRDRGRDAYDTGPAIADLVAEALAK